MEATLGDDNVKLGSARFVGAEPSADETPEVWYRKGGASPVRLGLVDPLREDAKEVVQNLTGQGYHLSVLSGDRPAAVAAVAEQLGIADAQGGVDPKRKIEALEKLRSAGKRILMVGDGLNDAPALAAAAASMSPASALEITQNAADVVFQGAKLAPIVYALHIARFSQKLVRQNFVLSFGYNIVAIPLAMAGHVTPLIAAIAMSSSSLLVVFNALRLNKIEG
jgi:Cu2+-exporting ATPase